MMPDIIDNVKVGEYIKKKLKEHHMTQDDLADALSISKSAVSQNLRGKSSFDIQNLILIAKLFNITLDDLLNLKSDAPNELVSEYQKVVQKGLSAITSVPKENLIISNPDMYGKVLMDYIIEARQKEMFLYFHENDIPCVDEFYHRAEEIILKIIQFMLEEGIDDVLDYILAYTRIHGSFKMIDEKTSMIIWGLLDQSTMQSFMSSFMVYKPEVKTTWSFKKVEQPPIPLTRRDFVDVIAKYHLKNVLSTYMQVHKKDEHLFQIIDSFVKENFLEGIHLYIDHYYTEPISWFKKVNLEVQKTYLRILSMNDFDLSRKFAEKGLFTDLTPIVKATIIQEQELITSHLIANYHEVINFRKIGEVCVQSSNIDLLKDIMTYLSPDDLNYLLGFVKKNDVSTMTFLLKNGARFVEKYYNLETFKKVNQFIDNVMDKEDHKS